MHQQGLRVFLRRLTGNHADGDDIAQESFVFAWQHIGRFDATRPFRPWLFGVAWHKYREHKRGWLRLMKRENQAAENVSAVICSDPGVGLDLTAALEGLSPEQRAVVLLCLMAEFSHAEAAETLALPLGTVKSHVARGRKKLVSMLGGSDG
jgi:DNA-directed RNA polymerase specialized sigma24 family protein